ncbi:2-thiouracil desulfurase family protein [Aquifex sp.]
MRKVLVSKCLLECGYRYDSKDVRVKGLKEKLKDCEVIAICPEVELLSLPVPRPRLKFVPAKDGVRLLREDDGRDFTEELRKKVREFLRSLGKIEEAYLKSKSPSCGVGDAKVYRCLDCEEEVGRRDGILTEELKKAFPDVKIHKL